MIILIPITDTVAVVVILSNPSCIDMHVYTPASDDCTSSTIRTRPDCSVVEDITILSFCHDILGTGLCEKRKTCVCVCVRARARARACVRV